MSFAFWLVKQRRPKDLLPDRRILWLMMLFALVATADVFRPSVPSLAVGLVGLKTWLLYLPLLPLGYALVDTEQDVLGLVRWILAAGTIPTIAGLLQGVLVYAGHAELAYRWYGSAASDVTQGFTTFQIGNGEYTRLSSTFTFVTQYYNFILTMVALSYGAYLAAGRSDRWRRGRAALLGVAIVAGFLSGARGAFVMIPLVLVMTTAFGGELKGAVEVAALAIIGSVVTVGLLGASLAGIAGVLKELIGEYAWASPVGQLATASHAGAWGLGTGTDTGAARFWVTAGNPVGFVENYYAKALLELGIPGLAVLVALMVALMIAGAAALRRTRDPVVHSVGAALLALLVVTIVNCWKGSYLDIDPMNVYFWLLAGVLLKLPALEKVRSAGRPAIPPARRLWRENEKWRVA